MVGTITPNSSAISKPCICTFAGTFTVPLSLICYHIFFISVSKFKIIILLYNWHIPLFKELGFAFTVLDDPFHIIARLFNTHAGINFGSFQILMPHYFSHSLNRHIVEQNNQYAEIVGTLMI